MQKIMNSFAILLLLNVLVGRQFRMILQAGGWRVKSYYVKQELHIRLLTNSSTLVQGCA